MQASGFSDIPLTHRGCFLRFEQGAPREAKEPPKKTRKPYHD